MLKTLQILIGQAIITFLLSFAYAFTIMCTASVVFLVHIRRPILPGYVYSKARASTPRPFTKEKEGPGIHCLRMRQSLFGNCKFSGY